MNREELLTDAMLFFSPNERSITAENGARYYREDVVLKAMELAGKESSLPPAEGAEQRIRVRNILQDFYRRGEYELEQAEEDIMRLFQQQPTAEGAEEILDKYPHSIEYPSFVHENSAIAAMTEFATLHAQRIAEKMVSERLRNELMRYDQWLLANDMGQMFDNTMKCVDEYLKTRESHDR